MTPQIVFNIFKSCGKYIQPTGYYKLSIHGIYWEARDLQSDGGISFYDYHGKKVNHMEVWDMISK